MTTKEMIRCKDCAYLVEGDNGEWVCADWDTDIHDVPDDWCFEDEPNLDFLDISKIWAIQDLGIEEYSDEWYELMSI